MARATPEASDAWKATLTCQRRGRADAAIVAFSLCTLITPAAFTQTPPTLQGAYLYGGANDQNAWGLAIDGGLVFLTGSYTVNPYSAPGLLWKVDATNGATLGSNSLDVNPAQVVVDGPNIYGAGNAVPPKCGATDGYGGLEPKLMFGIFRSSDLTQTSCESRLIFPSYRGYELYNSIAARDEGTERMFYAAGWAEQFGFGGHRYLVSKYDSEGTLTSTVVDPQTYSYAWGVASDSSGIYISGFRRNGSSHYLAELPFAVKLDPSLTEQWRTAIDAGAVGARARFYGLTVSGGSVYAAGSWQSSSGNVQYLAAKFSASDGTLNWYRVFGGTATDELYDVAVVDRRLFVAGHTNSSGSGGYGAVLMEVDPATGDVLNSIPYGGALDEHIYRMIADGSDLWLAGDSNSFSTDEGNVVGQTDMLLLHYRVNNPPVANAGSDQTVVTGPEDTASVMLDGTGSADPDGDALSYTWTGPFPEGGGTATGINPTVTLPLGESTITLVVNDGLVDSPPDTVRVLVLYGFSGFLQPVDNLPTINVTKAGSAIPVKWSLDGYHGMDVFASGYPVSRSIPCDAAQNADAIEQTVTAGASSLNYDSAAGQYIYVWKTEKAWAGSCRQLVIELKDGSFHRANFRFAK